MMTSATAPTLESIRRELDRIARRVRLESGLDQAAKAVAIGWLLAGAFIGLVHSMHVWATATLLLSLLYCVWFLIPSAARPQMAASDGLDAVGVCVRPNDPQPPRLAQAARARVQEHAC